MLVDAGLSLPDGVLIDNRFRGMSAEQIYNILESESESEQDSGNEGKDEDPGREKSKDNAPDGGDSSEPSAPITEGGVGQVLDAPPPDEDTPTIYHIFNHPQLGQPQSTFTTGRASGLSAIIDTVNLNTAIVNRITPVGSGTPREIRFALRLDF